MTFTVYDKWAFASCFYMFYSWTEQLPVKLGQEYRVKLGKSFTFPRENAYHTIKCESEFSDLHCRSTIKCYNIAMHTYIEVISF